MNYSLKHSLLICGLLLSCIACHQRSTDGERASKESAAYSAADSVRKGAKNQNSVAAELDDPESSQDPKHLSHADPVQVALPKSDLNSAGPVERSLLKGDAINMGVLKRLRSDDFDDFMTSFEQESVGNQESHELTKAYKEIIDQTLSETEGASPAVRFSCGATICMGYVHSQSDAQWFTDWSRQVVQSEKLPVRAMISENVPLPGGGVESRFLFSAVGDGGFYTPPGG